MILLSSLNAIIIAVAGWLGTTVIRLDKTTAALQPVLEQVRLSTASVIEEGQYEKDWDIHRQDHMKVDVAMADVQTRLQSIRLDITKFELQLQQALAEHKAMQEQKQPK